MSAMLDTYDMQVLDYSGDHDIQMHPSSSDHWFPDEAKMEEDGPAPAKDESDLHLNASTYAEEQFNVTIEVDMEPVLDSHNTEYDMLDGEEIHGAEILDVEVYDASHVQSPAMFGVDSLPGDTFSTFQDPQTEARSSGSLPIDSLHSQPEPADTHPITHGLSVEVPVSTEIQEVSYQVESLPESESAPQADPAPGFSESAAESTQDGVDIDQNTSPHEAAAPGIVPADDDNGFESDAAPQVSLEEPSAEQPHEAEVDDVHAPGSAEQNTEDYPPLVESNDNAESNNELSGSVSTGDPHEISAGVYIDPPPPVLLSMDSEDQFNFSLFNEPSVWNEATATSSTREGEQISIAHVLLSPFPTLYYEPLYTVFEALRQEETVSSTISTGDTELVLEAVDLQLIVSEDNFYAREVTLHDLNVLHNVSGIDGLLRMRLYTSAPRFITRYQFLQNEVSRLNLEPDAADSSLETTEEEALLQEGRRNGLQTQTDLETAQNDHGQDQTTRGETFEVVQVEEQTFDQEDSFYLQPERYEPTIQEQTIIPVSSSAQSADEAGSVDAAAGSDETGTRDEADLGHHDEISDERELHEATDTASRISSRFEEHNDNNEDENYTHHSTPTTESLDIGSRSDNEGDTIPLEVAEADLGNDSIYDEGHFSQSFDEEPDAQNGDVGRGYQQQSNEGNDYHEQEHEEGYTEEAFEEENNQEEGEYGDDGEHTAVNEHAEETPEYQDEQNSEDADNASSDEAHRVESLDTLEPSGQVDFEQVSAIDGETTGGEVEGDHVGATDVTYEESVSTHNLEEFSHTEETGNLVEPTSYHLLPEPDLLDGADKDWDYDLDDEGDATAAWDEDNEDATKSNSNASSATLSSKASKRGFDEVDSDGEYENQRWTPPSSPGPKRTRMQ